MQIIGVFNISNTEGDKFIIDLQKAINELQDSGQKVEVQYKVSSFPNGQVVYSALVLGRG